MTLDFSFINRMTKENNSPEFNRKWMADYTPRPSDVYICTYPKSGTNWAMQAAVQIAHLGYAQFEHIHDLVPYVENSFMDPIASLENKQIASQAPTGLRVIKTHLQRSYLKFNHESRYIVIIRDPKDIIVSYYRFVNPLWKARVGLTYPLEIFVERFISPQFIEGSWAAHLASWWAVKNEPNILLLTYNEMKENPSRCYQQMANVMNVSLTPHQLYSVASQCEFRYMQSIGHKFDVLRKAKTDGQANIFRSGEIGSYKKLLTPIQQVSIDNWCMAELKQFNCDFPYHDQFLSQPRQ